MRNLALFLACFSFLLVTGIASFINSSYQFSEPLHPALYIEKAPPGWSDEKTLDEIAAAAEAGQFNLYRRSLHSPADNSLFFSFAGNPSRAFPEGTVKAFNPKHSFTVKPYQHFDEYTLLGNYYSDTSDPALMSAAAETLRAKGFKLEAYKEKNHQELDDSDLAQYFLVFTLLDGGGIAVVGMAGLFAGAIHHSSRRYRDCIVKVTCGHYPTKALLAELLTMAAIYALAAALAALIILPALYWYNGFAQVGGFAAFMLAAFLIGLGLLLLGNLLVSLRLNKQTLFAILKGYRPVWLIGLSSLLLQTLALLMVTVTLLFGGVNTSFLLKEIQHNEKWAKIDGYAALRDISRQENGDLQKVTKLIQEQESLGKLLMAAADARIPQYIEGPDPATVAFGSYREYKHQALVINNNYLLQQDIYEANGQLVKNLPEQKDHIQVLVGHDYSQPTEAIIAGIQEWARFSKQMQQHTQHREQHKNEEQAQGQQEKPPVAVEVIKLAPGQQLFRYDLRRWYSLADADERPEPALLIFAPAKSEVLAPTYYEGYIGQGGLFFAEPAEIKKRLLSSGISESYAIDYPIAQVRLEYRNSLFTRLAIQAAVFIASALALLMSGSVLTRIYCEHNARRHFVERISGSSFLRMHWLYLSLSGALALLLSTLALPQYPSLIGYALALLLCGIYLMFILWQLSLNQRHLGVRVLNESSG